MDPDELFCRYQELQTYVGWTEADARRVQAVGPLLEPCFPALIDDFYEEIDRHPEARKVITGGPAQVASWPSYDTTAAMGSQNTFGRGT